jgi:hypothetical protein
MIGGAAEKRACDGRNYKCDANHLRAASPPVLKELHTSSIGRAEWMQLPPGWGIVHRQPMADELGQVAGLVMRPIPNWLPTATRDPPSKSTSRRSSDGSRLLTR